MPTNDTSNDCSAADKALKELIGSLARLSIRATESVGLDFDTGDPRVARWLLLETLRSLLTPNAQITARDSLVRAASYDADRQTRSPSKSKAKARPGRLLVTWEDLVLLLSDDGQPHAAGP